MNNSTTNHYSHKLEFNLNKIPAKVSDRTSWRFLLPGIVFGALLFLLGLYEMLNVFNYTNQNVAEIVPLEALPNYKPIFDPIIFDIIFMIVGFGIIAASVGSYLRYRKFIFDGKKMMIGDRSVWGKKRIAKESIRNYLGVRFRVAFYQSGLVNSNKYIIELYHKDPEKIVPLYISTSPENVRKKWKEYARFFRLPALINTDEGLQFRELKNLDKPIKEIAKLGFIVDDFDSYEELPCGICFARRKDKIVLKTRRIIWDAYNFIAWFAIIVIGFGLVGLLLNPQAPHLELAIPFYALVGLMTFILIAAIFVLFRKEKLVLKKHKIVHTHKYMMFSTKHNEINKDEIEAIEVTQNPASGRFFVSIISDNKTVAFGAKLPINTLKWIKRFLIHDVIR